MRGIEGQEGLLDRSALAAGKTVNHAGLECFWLWGDTVSRKLPKQATKISDPDNIFDNQHLSILLRRLELI